MASYKSKHSISKNMSRTTLWRRKHSQRLIKSLSERDSLQQGSGAALTEMPEWHLSDTSRTKLGNFEKIEASYSESKDNSAQIRGSWNIECSTVSRNALENESSMQANKDFSSQYSALGIMNESWKTKSILEENENPELNNKGSPNIPISEQLDVPKEIPDWFHDENEYEFQSDKDWFSLPESSTVTEDLPLYPGAPISVCASLLLILNFTFFHGLTGEGLSDLLVLISLHCIKPNQCLTSLYKFRKFFKHLKNPLFIHKFCNNCSKSIADCEKDNCKACNGKLTNNMSYFIEIPLAPQLKDFYSRPGFYEELQHRFTKNKKTAKNIEDIYDGRLYREQCSTGTIPHNQQNISLMWYTDGVPLFQSSKFSIWPILFTINELPFNKRTKTENVILGGLWFGETKPCMLTFWEPIAKSLNDLKENGVEVTLPSSTVPFLTRVQLLCGTCDLPAKCIMLNMVQFNGKFGCPKCLQPGRSVPTGHGTVWVYPFDKENIDGPKRTHADTLKHARSAHDTNQNIFGIKGPSWLSCVQGDVINGTAIDFMHAGYLGIVRRLLALWFDSKFSKEIFSLSKFVTEVDERLLTIKPPNYISRVPRSIAKHKKYWKASECRSWLYYYSLPVLLGIMESEFFQHYMLLVEAAYTLNLESISHEQLHHCHKLLVQFVCMFSALYGEQYMSINVHQLLHLVDVVRDLGPLWTYSCFSLEDFNGRLLKLFHGTQHPELQIVDAVATLAKLPSLNHQYISDPTLGAFLSKLSKYPGSCAGVKLSGFLASNELTTEQKNALTSVCSLDPGSYQLFTRLQNGNLTVPSQSCKSITKRNSYTVECYHKDSRIVGQVYYFIKKYCTDCIPSASTCTTANCKHKDVAMLKELKASSSVFPYNDYGSLCSHTSYVCESSCYVTVPVDCIRNILVCTEVDGKKFVTHRPNRYEPD